MFKMKHLAILAFAPVLATAALLPDTIGTHTKGGPGAVLKLADADRSLWSEMGLKQAEAARYAPNFTVTVCDLADSTAAMEAYLWRRPPSAKPSKAAPLAAETPDGILLVLGNYLVDFHGYKPSKAEIEGLQKALPKPDQTPLPNLHLPTKDVVPNSERYITGPVALQAFLPAVRPELAAFQLGTEGQVAVFHSPKGDVTAAVFSYPTPQIAMKQAAEFEKAGMKINRSGPLITVVAGDGGDAELAQTLLKGVQYKADVTVPEHIWTAKDNIGNLVINAFILIGILLSITVVAGLFVGGYRAYQRRGGRDPDANAVITLHLE
jgi:hypothetical protein